MQTLIAGMIVAFLAALLILRSVYWHLPLSADTQPGVQKIHEGAIPRIGGVAVALGLTAALAWAGRRGLADKHAASLLVAALPAVMAGLAEDLTKRIGATARLTASALSAVLGIWLLDAILPRVGVPGLDALIAATPVAGILLTVIAISGLTNAINIIDGFNGLATVVSMMMFGAMGYVAWLLGDVWLTQICLAMIGALLGFFFWNYPRGLIFLGDGGAYLVGFILAEVAILLVIRHPDVSPWYCLLVCLYPITETLFSIYRRYWVRGISPGIPDGLHLHMLIYRRLLHWAAGPGAVRDVTVRNSATSPYLWAMSSLSIVPAVLFWRSEVLLVLSAALFVIAYVALYVRLIRFRSPRWLRRQIK